MSNYDQQYQTETALFGEPYPEFVSFLKGYGISNGRALDIGCGQGRDALILARHGYHVIGVDASQVGVAQMVAQAEAGNLSVEGIVADFYVYEPNGRFDAIVLDSILHFEKGDKAKELNLLNRLSTYLNEGGHFFIFVHKSAKKEKELHNWLRIKRCLFSLVENGYVTAVYEEKASGFRAKFQMYMFILQRKATGEEVRTDVFTA